MALEPTIFRSEDLHALVSDVLLELATGSVEPAVVVAAEELSAAAQQAAVTDSEDSRAFFWAAAVEAGLHLAIEGDVAHRTLAEDLMVRANELAEGQLPPVPIGQLLEHDIEDHWKVGIAVQTLSFVVSGIAVELSPEKIRDNLIGASQVAETCRSRRLSVAVDRFALRLGLGKLPHPTPQLHRIISTNLDPDALVAQIVSGARPDLCESALLGAALEEVSDLIGGPSDAALRCADLLEAIACAACWPAMIGGPDKGWGSVRNDNVFDALFYRAASIGAARRTGELRWSSVRHLVGLTDTIWIRELSDDFSSIVLVSHSPESGWRSRLLRLSKEALDALWRVRRGEIRKLADQDFQRLGTEMFGDLLSESSDLHHLTVVASEALRCLPVDALQVNGREIIESCLVGFAPSLNAIAGRIGREDPVERSDRLRVVGLFDSSLKGAQFEIEALKTLHGRGLLEVEGFNGPALLSQALAVLPNHVVESTDGWATDGGVVAVMVVHVQPLVESPGPSGL